MLKYISHSFIHEVINNNKYRLKYWFAMVYIHGKKFMIGSLFTYQRLSKDFHVTLSVLTKVRNELKLAKTS